MRNRTKKIADEVQFVYFSSPPLIGLSLRTSNRQINRSERHRWGCDVDSRFRLALTEGGWNATTNTAILDDLEGLTRVLFVCFAGLKRRHGLCDHQSDH